MQISMTDFIDIVSLSGTPKATKIKEVKNRPAYNPACDFYKPLREHIENTHVSGLPKSSFVTFTNTLTDTKKQQNYSSAVQGYASWWGNKNLVWFSPPSGIFEAHGVQIRVNPEVGFIINGKRHIVKLYFKAPALAKNRVAIATHLMDTCLRQYCEVTDVMAVLDVRNSKLISPPVPINNLTDILMAEMAYIATLWPHV